MLLKVIIKLKKLVLQQMLNAKLTHLVLLVSGLQRPAPPPGCRARGQLQVAGAGPERTAETGETEETGGPRLETIKL